MASNPSSQPSTAAQTASGSFAERISFATVYSGLEKRGISLTNEEKKKFEDITLDELRRNNGQMLGNDIGNSLTNLVYLLLGFLQNIFKGVPSELNQLGSHLADTGSFTLEQGKNNQLHTATIRIHMRLSSEGGNLARAAELATGQKPVTGKNTTPTADMNESILRQLLSVKIPADTVTSLNQRMEIPSVPNASDNSLTSQR